MANLGILLAVGVCLPGLVLLWAWPRFLETRAAQLMQRGSDRQAAALLERALACRVRRHGNDSLKAARTRADLARVRLMQGRRSEATRHIQDAARAVTTYAGKPSAVLVSALISLAQAVLDAGWSDEAARICGQALPLAKRCLAGNDPRLGTLEALVGDVYANLGDLEIAHAHYEQALQRFRLAGAADDSNECAEVLASMAKAMLREQRWAEARETGVKAVEILDQTGGPALPRALAVLADLHAERGNLAEAESLRLSVCQLWERLAGADSANLAQEYERRAELLARMQRNTEAVYLERKAARIRQLNDMEEAGV